MIYIEQICNDDDDARIVRQKNHVDGEWYGICLEYTNNKGEADTADNETWLFDTLKDLENKEWSKVGEELGVCWDKKNFKQLRKVLREAKMLGWLDSIDPV